MSYLMNTWYVAAMDDEVPEGKLLARTFLGENVVLFRGPDGTPKALTDRCPHRFAPLSAGKLCAGEVQCGYHGLRFDARGMCVHNPHGLTPKATTVRAFPLREVGRLLWIWMGEPAKADEALIPDFSELTNAPIDATMRGYLPTACETALLVDNILDLSHVDFLHPSSLGSGGLSKTQAVVDDLSERSVKVAWLSSGELAPPVFDGHLREQGQPTDQWTEVTWTAPSSMYLAVGATLQGEPRSQGISTWNLHLGTPEVPGRTHYWYWSTRNFAISPQENEFIHAIVADAFKNEDKMMLEAQQSRMEGVDFWDLKPVLLAPDAAAVRVRRKMKALLEQEAAV